MVSNMGTGVQLTTQQSEAIQEIERNLQIIACAGSGKTEVITRRIANILQSRSDIKPKNIVAFTFTEKAAESMKRRIVKALDDEGAVDGMLEKTCQVTVEDTPDVYVSITHNGAVVSGQTMTLDLEGKYLNLGAISSEENDTFT